MAKYTLAVITMIGIALTCACKGGNGAAAESANEKTTSKLYGPFNADSAYRFVSQQVDFGPRVPGSDAHAACARFLHDKLASYADTVIMQKGQATAYNGDKLPIYNIIGSFNKANSRRILLLAHWDSRPWADMDPKPENRTKPVPGANDGASGVGVLMEIARNLAQKAPSVGVDIMFVDTEDYGHSGGFSSDEDSWCLGTQYWTKNIVPYSADNLPIYGILLDMVGGRDAQFYFEAFSAQNAATPTNKVWGEAEQLGYGNRFPKKLGGAITDDHVFLTRAGIPTTDIIETLNPETQSFNPTWHTLDDNMSNIDPSSLKAVGQTVLNVVYKEKPY